jgi:DNA-binding winged helix-turn-helix (wHTH) protein
MTIGKGLSIFMTKTAEAEMPWLVQHAFVPPPDFEFFKGPHSNVIYAKPGAGKTTLMFALEEYARHELEYLPVRWTPDLTGTPQPASTELAKSQFASILSACACQIAEELPSDFKKRAKDDVKFRFLIDFLHHFLPQENKALLVQKIPPLKVRITDQNTPINVIAVELAKSLKHIGFPDGLWVMVDRLDLNSEARKQAATSILQSILSSLSFFEIPNFHLKMFLPLELEGDLGETTAITKERATETRIAWDTKQLRTVIEKRLCYALGDEQIQADQVYPVAQLFPWLEGCGGLSPRGWLEYFRPIFATLWEIYNAEGLSRLEKRTWILDGKEWTAARKRSSLRLRFKPETSQISVGMNSPHTLSQEELALFSYLHKNEGRYCSKREIYNKAYLPFVTQGEIGATTSDDVVQYEDLINTAISRLRKTLEPLPKDPVFLITKKDRGYRLSLQAFREDD